MKKLLKILCIVLAIIAFIVAIFFYFKLYMSIQMIEGIECDGFGDPLVRGQPYSKKSIFLYGFGALGVILLSISSKLKESK